MIFMSDEFVKWIGVIGSVASLIGLPIAIWQIYKTRLIAEATMEASIQTQKSISKNLLLSDISVCIKYIEEIRSYLKADNFESAQIRIIDLISQLIQIREILKNSRQVHQVEFKERLTQLSIIRETFEKKLVKSSVKINIVRIKSQLSEISDELNKVIGEIKTAIEKDK